MNTFIQFYYFLHHLLDVLNYDYTYLLKSSKKSLIILTITINESGKYTVGLPSVVVTGGNI